MRWCWVNFQCRDVLLIWIIIGQGPIALAVGAGKGYVDIFSLVYYFSQLSPSLWESIRYRLKYCLKGPLIPKQPIKPTNLCSNKCWNENKSMEYVQTVFFGMRITLRYQFSRYRGLSVKSCKCHYI